MRASTLQGLGILISGNYTHPGVCTTQRIVGGRQTCAQCGAARSNGAACPKEAAVCCGDGTCQKTIEGCTCSSSSDCDSTSCCTGNLTKPGHCAPAPYDANGTRVCQLCRADSAGSQACPGGRGVCCRDGTCRPKLSDCGCRKQADCPDGFCCSAKNGTRGHCSPSVFAGGKQVCPMCEPGAGGDLACPREARFCCPDGSCKKDASLCQCAASHDCPAKHCCSGFRHGKRGTCVAQPFANGTQVCPDCMHFGFQGLSCPAGASTCCADGTCKPSLQSCKCTSDAECDYGSCCTPKNFCSAQAFVKGLRVCSNCTTFTSRGVACPSAASQCCADGICRATC
eukprot:jgi/Mesen1/5386/ME000268S04585